MLRMFEVVTCIMQFRGLIDVVVFEQGFAFVLDSVLG